MIWPSLKAEWQKVLDSPPFVKPKRLTQPVSERDRLRVERHDEPKLTGLEREALREEIERLGHRREP